MSGVYGFDEFQKKMIKLAEKEAPQSIDEEVTRLLMMGLADVKLLTPVKSGAAKRSWTVSKVENGKGELGSNLEYVPHIEKGYKDRAGNKVKGKHMLEQTVEQIERRLPDELQRFFDKLAGDLKL